MVKLGGVGPGGLDSDWIPLVNWILILRVPGEESQTTRPQTTKATQMLHGMEMFTYISPPCSCCHSSPVNYSYMPCLGHDWRFEWKIRD